MAKFVEVRFNKKFGKRLGTFTYFSETLIVEELGS